MLRRWTRKDGVVVTFTQLADNTSIVRVWRPNKSMLIQKEYPSWQRWEAADTAQELAELLDCQLEDSHAA